MLQPSPGAGQVEEATRAIPVVHGDFTTLFDELGWLKLRAKEGFDGLSDFLPSGFRVGLLVNLMAEVAQDLCCLAFAQQDVDATALPFRLSCRKARLWRKESESRFSGLGRHRHPLGILILTEPQGAAVKGLLVSIVEFKTAGPDSVV